MCVAVNTVETPFIHVNKWCSVCPYHVVSAPEERNKCFWICSVLLTAGNDFRVLWCADATKQMKFKLTEDVSRLKTQQKFREFKSTLEGLFYLYIYIDWLIDWLIEFPACLGLGDAFVCHVWRLVFPLCVFLDCYQTDRFQWQMVSVVGHGESPTVPVFW